MNKCKFCNAKEFKYKFNSVSGLEKTLKIALEQSKVRHVLISSGSARVCDLPKLKEYSQMMAYLVSDKFNIKGEGFFERNI